jgi:hypothetical protein
MATKTAAEVEGVKSKYPGDLGGKKSKEET